jgi:hypothetical protein
LLTKHHHHHHHFQESIFGRLSPHDTNQKNDYSDYFLNHPSFVNIDLIEPNDGLRKTCQHYTSKRLNEASAHKQALSYQRGLFESLSKAFRARKMPTTGAAP